MKKYLSSILLFVMILLVASCNTRQTKRVATKTANADSLISFSFKEYDFGEYREQVVKSCTFKYKNLSRKPLVIYRAEADCGCTQIDFSKKPLKYGQMDSLVVKYDGNGFLNGSFHKTIRLYTNLTVQPLELSIKGSYFKSNDN